LLAPWFSPTQSQLRGKEPKKAKTSLDLDQGPSETRNRNLGRRTLAQGSSDDRVRHLIVMVIFAIGFARLWFIEQKKKRKRKEALRQKEIERG
jgi:hypothetical protein